MTLREQLLDPASGQSTYHFLQNLGVGFTPLPDSITHKKAISIHIEENSTTYRFKRMEDASSFIEYLERNDVSYGIPNIKKEATHPYSVVLVPKTLVENTKKTHKPTVSELKNIQRIADISKKSRYSNDKTYYTPESLNEAIEAVKTLKNIVVRAQNYEVAADLRDIEKFFIEKVEQDKNRRI